MNKRLLPLLLLPALILTGGLSTPLVSAQEVAFAPFNVPVPEPSNLHMYVADRQAGIQLGKALFWDMQLGSDGMTACATCHHHAGSDSRSRNSVHPGVDGQFHGGRANADLTLADFPFVRFSPNPESQLSTRIIERDDRVGAQGVNRTRFFTVVEGQAVEPGRTIRDDTFTRNARNLRQNTPRTAPTVVNAVFNFANFWDGRANHFFNGVDPFGPLNQGARVWINNAGVLEAINLVDFALDGNGQSTNPYLLNNASLASQAVGPVLDSGEMSWVGRSWPDVGRKMLSLRPLGRQQVHPADSALASLRHSSGQGLAVSYGELIQATFRPEFWNSSELIDGHSQMEANFSLFFGLAVQLYQSILVADQTPFDAWNLDPLGNPLSPSAEQGRVLFNAVGCTNCHIGPEMTGASVSFTTNPQEAGLIEIMGMGDGQLAGYDIGFYNIGVTPTTDDRGRGRNAPFTLTDGQTPMPLSFSRQFWADFNAPGSLGFPPVAQPGCVNDFLAEPPTICDELAFATERVAVDGAFKTPGLRNVALTGPYMHDGGMATLMQVVDFYARGNNFPQENLANLDPEMIPIPQLQNDPAARRALVDFLLALTDERVRLAQAPFDHPQLIIPNGHTDLVPGNPKRVRILTDNLVELPAIGRLGRGPEGLAPLKPFLADNLEGIELQNFHYQP